MPLPLRRCDQISDRVVRGNADRIAARASKRPRDIRPRPHIVQFVRPTAVQPGNTGEIESLGRVARRDIDDEHVYALRRRAGIVLGRRCGGH